MLEAISRNGEESETTTPIAEDAMDFTAPLYDEDELEPAPRDWRAVAFLIVLGLAGAAWIGAIATAFIQPTAENSLLARVVTALTFASGPLALLGIGYLLLQRTSRREAKRFANTATAMRAEANNLERVIAILSARIEDNRQTLAAHGHQLLSLGEDTTGRLADVATMMQSETARLAAHSEKLALAASTARNDLAVLSTDVPQIDSQIREISTALREAGLDAHAQAGALESQLVALAARGRDADEHAGGAAQRLAAHLARIESIVENAGQKMDSAATRMNATIDAALAGASEAVDHTRQTVDAQRAAMLAMVEQSAASLDRAGTDAAHTLSQQITEIRARIDDLAGRISAQNDASRALMDGIDHGLGNAEQRFGALRETGGGATTELSTALEALREQAEHMAATLAGGDNRAEGLTGRIDVLRTAIAASRDDLETVLPAALDRVEAHAARGREAIVATLPEAARLESSIADSATRLADADAILIRQRVTLDAIGNDTIMRLAELERHGTALGLLFTETGDTARTLAQSAGPELIEALLRVRETAAQAATRAREALTAVIPETAAALGEASREAMERAFDERVEQQMASISVASERAVQAASNASERLIRQMLTIAETTNSVEARIEQHKADTHAADEANLTRRVALLIESLNSTAIDVTKILSSDVSDSAWTAYLKGDRSIFTRRAVRLIDSADAREIVRHYDEDPNFREQVNRYIHDFESMLRRVLASRDGAPLSVTLLSSDTGKLYVALAQAIERLRT